MPKTVITPHPDVVDTELDGGETVLLHLGTKRYFSLNATGTVIWRALRNGFDPDAVVRELQLRYDVGAEQAKGSVTALLDSLTEQQLVQRSDGS